MTSPPRRCSRRDWALAVVALGFLAAVRAGILQERDPYWQVRAGVENLAGAPLSRPDTWSWAPVDAPFTQTSPLWNDLLGAAWKVAGFPGFFMVGLLSIWAYGLVVLLLARRLGARPLPALLGITSTLLLALPFLSPRGALAAQTLFLGALAVAHAALPRLARGTPAAVVGGAAAAGFSTAALGIWLHLSWLLLAPALGACVLVMALLTPDLTRRRVILLGSALIPGLAAGVLAGPYGADAWALSRRVQEATRGVVIEWQPVWTPGLATRWLPTALIALVIAGWALRWLWHRQPVTARHPGTALGAGLLTLAAPAAVAGFTTIRVVGLALLTLAPLVGYGVTRMSARLRLRAGSPRAGSVLRHARVQHWMTAQPWRMVTVLVLVLLSPVVLVAGSGLGRPPEAEALSALPQGCRLVSDPGTADAVLLLRPDVTVWIDTRADYWGRERNARAVRLVTDGVDASGVLDRATCAAVADDDLLPTTGVERRLAADPSWSRIRVDGPVTMWSRIAP